MGRRRPGTAKCLHQRNEPLPQIHTDEDGISLFFICDNPCQSVADCRPAIQ
jgi:hypothetical protein